MGRPKSHAPLVRPLFPPSFSVFTEFRPGYADVKIGQDGRSRGYGIVRFDDASTAQAAMEALNGFAVGDPPRNIIVREDRPAPE